MHTVTPSPKSQTVEFMYYIRETQLTSILETQLHGSRAGETPSTEDMYVPDLLVLTTYIGRPHQAPEKN